MQSLLCCSHDHDYFVVRGEVILFTLSELFVTVMISGKAQPAQPLLILDLEYTNVETV
jgi:hypothetical protein